MAGKDGGWPGAASRDGIPARPPWAAGRLRLPGLAAVTAVATAVATGGGAAAAGTATAPGRAGAAPAIPASAAAGRAWRIIKTVRGADSPGITAVSATGTGHAWAFQSTTARPTAWRLTGTTWARVAFPGRVGDRVTAAAASAPSNVWAFTAQPGGSSRALRWTGHRWAIVARFRQLIGDAVVLGRADVWIFGQPVSPGASLGTWHYNGRAWRRYPAVRHLTGGSALSPDDIWAVGGKTAARWTGHGWTTSSLARVLPGNTMFCHPTADQVYALSPRDVWATGAGHCEDERGPFYLLHFNGRRWRLAASSARYGEPVQLVPDGSGGLWIPTVAGFPGTFAMLHYSAGRLRRVAMPRPGTRLTVLAAGHVPHSVVTFGGGAAYPASGPGLRQSAVILRYGP
jgi:hypothetical protein